MTLDTTEINVGKSKILDLDADEKGNFIAFTDHKTVITNEHNINIEIDVRFPKIRRLNTNKFLIVDSRTKNNNNGFIFDFNGKLIQSFLAGDGIEDVIVHHNKIIISYFDEGVLVSDVPNQDGLSVFNIEGKQEFGANTSVGGLLITDCYCICKHETNSVLFYAYTDFEISELNLDTFTIESYETPVDFAGSSAMSSIENEIIFHSSYHDKTSFFSWNRNKNEVTKFGNYPSRLRGLKNGKFLIFGDSSYTIINSIELKN